MNTRAARVAPFVAVLLAPVLGVVVFRAPLMSHLAYRDPWLYSGYGWTLAHHVEVFGWFYYAVRFPVTLPIRWTTDLFGPVLGYVVLRYVILVATGAVVYLCVRRFASVLVACAAVVLLALNPFYMRMVLWDYTSYVALPCAIAGVAVWLMAATRGASFWPFVGSGALLGASFFANALSGTFILPLLLVEGVAALRRGTREVSRFAVRCVGAAIGALLVFVGGYLGYAAYLGGFDPYDLLEATLEFVKANDQRAAPFQLPPSEFLDGEPRIWGPVLLCLALVVVLGRRLWANDLAGRLGQFVIAYLAFVWFYRLAITSAVVETWWAYNMVAISTCFAVPLMLDELEKSLPRRTAQIVVAAAVVGTAVTSVAIRYQNVDAVSLYERIRDNGSVLVVLIAAGLGLAVALKLLRRPSARAAAIGVLFALVAFLSLTPARYIGTGQTGEFGADGRAELRAYEAAYEMAKLLEDVDQPDRRALLWTTLTGSPVVSWTNLPHQGGSINDPEKPLPALNELSPAAKDHIRYPTTVRVLLLSQDPSDIDRGMTALRRELRAPPFVLREGSWGDDYLQYALVALAPR